MSVICAAINAIGDENNENVPVNGLESNKYRDDFKDYSGSQDLFSDDEQLRNGTALFSPKVVIANNTSNSSSILLKTPVFLKSTEETPGKPKVPKTPGDLLPFITKPSLLWTSDMETPKDKLKEIANNCDKTEDAITINCTPPQQKLLNCENMETKNVTVLTSPVLGGKKRSKRYAKRRLLPNVVADIDADQQSSVSSTSDRVPSDTTDEPVRDDKSEKSVAKETHKCAMDKLDKNENKKLEEAAVLDKNSNTSTQEFFFNATFTSVDRICSNMLENVAQEGNSSLKNKSEASQSKSNEFINIENKSVDVGDDVLDRVAAIKRNQKPVRRLTDITPAVIPKEVFSNSVRELEIANVKFNREKRETSSQPTKSTSFTTFSALKENSEKSEKSVNQEAGSSQQFNDTVPPELMDDWNAIVDIKAIKAEEFDVKPLVKNCVDTSIVSTVSRKGAVNEIFDDAKMKRQLPDVNASSSEAGDRLSMVSDKDMMKNENSNENTYSIIGPQKDKLAGLQIKCENGNTSSPFTSASCARETSQGASLAQVGTSKEAEKLQLSEDHESGEFSKAKFSVDSCEVVDDGFTTAGGKGIKVSKEKESHYANVYSGFNDIDEDSLSKMKTKKTLQVKLPNAFKKPMDKAVVVYNEDKTNFNNKTVGARSLTENGNEVGTTFPKTATATDSFSTAGGKKIQVNDEKENYYSSIYNELGDVDEGSLRDLKTKKKRLPQKISRKPMDKAVIVFMKKDNSNANTPGTSATPDHANTIATAALGDAHLDSSFSTAGGKRINVDDEKESYYSNVYKELGDVSEDSLSSLKANKKRSSAELGKTFKRPTDKAVIVFNEKKNNRNVEAGVNASDGFATAGGKSIAVKPEREEFYSEMYAQLSKEINDEDSFLRLVGKNHCKSSAKDQPVAKSSKSADQSEKSHLYDAKLLFRNGNDADEAIANLDCDLEKLLQPHNSVKTESTASKYTSNNHLLSSLPKARYVGAKLRSSSPLVQQPVMIRDQGHGHARPQPPKSHIGMLKRKLEACEQPRRPDRCRSFGGFPATSICKSEGADDDGPKAVKLNKSVPPPDDPNRPLQTDLSVSQQFDSHSDSWLSKVEISFLNCTKITESIDDAGKKEEEAERTGTASAAFVEKSAGDLAGFSSTEGIESLRRYLSFDRFLRTRHRFPGREGAFDLNVHPGETVNLSISNRTSACQLLSVQHACNLNVEKDSVAANRFSLDLREIAPRLDLKLIDNLGEKRKHLDSDSDDNEDATLTAAKKPRIGFEFRGKKLFSDDECDDARDTDEPARRAPDDRVEKHEVERAKSLGDEDLSEDRRNALHQQEIAIKCKRQMTVKPVIGSLLRARLENSKNRKSWSDFVGDSVPIARDIEQIKQADGKVLEVTASNASSYKFTTSNFIGDKKIVSLDIGDGASLIFDENGHAGVTEFANAFSAMPGVDPKLLPSGWIENHYGWIVWKCASMDRICFNSKTLPRTLKPNRVMQELKYRYDREIDRAERPALRKIIEKDDGPSRRMVLCISSIQEIQAGDVANKEARVKLGLQQWKIEATDGWYSIPLTLDTIMTNNILNGKIKEGTKIITYGAELLNCERGFYPLQKPANVSLKICANCTRRARWDSKLGFQRSSRPVPIKLKSILPSGGMVGQVTAVAARVYPLMYREKTADGQSIYRNARAEEKAANAHERACELKLDAMYAEARKKFESNKKSDSDEEFELSHMERREEHFKQKLQSRVREGLPPPRQVTPVLKVRLMDDRTTALLSIWGASEDSHNDIKEGSTITMYNATASGMRDGELTLTANRFTHIKKETLLKLPYPIRTCTRIPDIVASSSPFEPKFNEFDTVGIVVSAGPMPQHLQGMKNFDVANLAYPEPNDSGSTFLPILFWGGIGSFGYQSLFTAGTIVACSNLEWRPNGALSAAIAYCSEKSVFSTNPRSTHLLAEYRHLKDLVQNTAAYAESCVEKAEEELSKKLKLRSNQSTPINSASDRFCMRGNTSLLGAQESPASMSVQRRLEKLSQYGGCNGVSESVSTSIVLNNSSTRVKKDFTPVAPRGNA